MRALSILVGAIALALPAVASATGGAGESGREEKRAFGQTLFVSVAVDVCKERQLRPFGRSDDAEQWARKSNRRCVKRLLQRERLLVRSVIACTERLADEETLNRRSLSQCMVALLLRRLGIAGATNEESKPKQEEEKPKEEAKDDPPASDAAAVLACKEELHDEEFADAHDGRSFVSYYGDDESDEREAFLRCVKSKLSDD